MLLGQEEYPRARGPVLRYAARGHHRPAARGLPPNPDWPGPDDPEIKILELRRGNHTGKKKPIYFQGPQALGLRRALLRQRRWP